MSSTFTRLVATELRVEMTRRDITQVELGARLNRPQSTISRWVKGRSALDVDDLMAICSALDLSVGEILQRAEAAMRDEQPARPTTESRWTHCPSDGSLSSQVSGMFAAA